MSSQTLSVSFESLRKISKIVALPLTKNVRRGDKIAVGIYLFAVYLYCAIFFSRKFDLQNEIDDCIYGAALFYLVPRITLMRMNRLKLVDLLILLETSKKYKIKRAAELRSELKRPLTILAPFAVGGAAYVAGILGWLLTDNQSSFPFGAMPMWIMNYNYTACFIFQITMIALMAMDYTLGDTIKLCTMLQLRIHFKYLTVSIREVLDDAKGEFCSVNKVSPDLVLKSNAPWIYQRKQLGEIIKHHNYVTKVANETEQVFNKCVLVTFINLSFLLCTILFRVANSPLFTTEFFKLSVYIIGLCTLFCGDCYFTERVIEENKAFVDSCYNVDFIGTCIAFQKSLILIMARGQKSVPFTIGKFAPIGVVTIVAMVKVSYSYFTLLQNLRNQ